MLSVSQSVSKWCFFSSDFQPPTRSTVLRSGPLDGGDQVGLLGRGQGDCGRRLLRGVWSSSQPDPPSGCIKSTSRQPPKGRRAQLRTTAFLRQPFSLVGVRAQASLLLGRLEEIGPGAAAAACRRNLALQMERTVANQRRADALCRIQNFKKRTI